MSNYVVISNYRHVQGFFYKENDKNVYIDIKPGKNIIPGKIWKSILDQNKDDFQNCHDSFIYAKELSKGLSKDDPAFISELNVQEAQDSIEGMGSKEELKKIKSHEKSDKKRKTILKAIEDQEKKINKIEALYRAKKQD